MNYTLVKLLIKKKQLTEIHTVQQMETVIAMTQGCESEQWERMQNSITVREVVGMKSKS